jgi:hypothetical protein
MIVAHWPYASGVEEPYAAPEEEGDGTAHDLLE